MRPGPPNPFTKISISRLHLSKPPATLRTHTLYPTSPPFDRLCLSSRDRSGIYRNPSSGNPFRDQEITRARENRRKGIEKVCHSPRRFFRESSLLLCCLRVDSLRTERGSGVRKSRPGENLIRNLDT